MVGFDGIEWFQNGDFERDFIDFIVISCGIEAYLTNPNWLVTIYTMWGFTGSLSWFITIIYSRI